MSDGPHDANGRHLARWLLVTLAGVLITIGGAWASYLQTKVDTVSTIQSGRGERITKLEADMAHLQAEVPRLSADIAALRLQLAQVSLQLERLSGTLGRRGFIGGSPP